MNTLGSYFAIHFSPILILLFPVYAIAPSVATLLFMKSLILACASIPLYYLSKAIISDDRISLIIGVAYLLHPGIQGANWFDFQQQIFIPILTFTTILMLIRESWTAYFASLLLTLTVQEHVFTIMILLLLSYLSYSDPYDVWQDLRARKLNRHSAVIISIVVCLLFYVVASSFIRSFPIEPVFMQRYRAIDVFRVLGFNGNTLLLPLYALTHIGRTVRALIFDFYYKLLYAVFMLSPLIFLPLMSRFILPNLITIVPFFMSNYRAYYMIGSHYSLYLIPSLFISLVYAFRNKLSHEKINLARNMLIVATTFVIILSPISPLSGIVNESSRVLWYPSPFEITDRTRKIHDLIDTVPSNASILTQNHIFPHVSSRVNAYLLPIDDFKPNETETIVKYIDSLIDECEYILLDLRAFDHWTSYAHRRIVAHNSFDIEALTDNVVLFKQGAEGELKVYELDHRVYRASADMYVATGQVVNNTGDGKRGVVICPKGSEEGFCVYGPYTYVTDGAYDLTFQVRVEGRYEGEIGFLEATGSQGYQLLARRDLYGYEFQDGDWRNMTLRVYLERPVELVEFRVYAYGEADIYVDRIVLDRVEDDRAHSSTASFNHRSLLAPDAEVTEGGMLHYSGREPLDILWYGPYMALPAGDYRVSYYLKVIPLDPPNNDAMIILDACSNEGGNIISSRHVNWGDLAYGSADGWLVVNLDVTVRVPSSILEFRGRAPSPGYEIFLGHILLEPRS